MLAVQPTFICGGQSKSGILHHSPHHVQTGYAARPRQPSEDPFEDSGGDGGASAPSVGVLMELVAAVRCPDGRLIVLAYGMGRLRVSCCGLQIQGLLRNVSLIVHICSSAMAVAACCALTAAGRFGHATRFWRWPPQSAPLFLQH